MALAVRRRYVYPSCDLVTGKPRWDRALDSVLRIARRSPQPEKPGARADAAVFGFPRSGNTMLAAWLQSVARPDVVIHDGRATHSALDLLRFAETGMPVVIPVRGPMETNASFLVRHGRPDDVSLGRDLVEAYAAWYRMARHALDLPNVIVTPFPTTTREPAAVASWAPMGRLLDAAAIERVRLESFVEELRHDLAGVIGQGTEENGVPSAWLISVPDERRQEPLRQARVTLSDRQCLSAMLRAQDAYAALLTTARAHGSCLDADDASAAEDTVTTVMDYAQRSA